MKPLHYIMLLCAILLLSTAKANDKLQVVTSIPPLNAFAAGLLEGVAQPTLLIPPNASHHHFALKPSNMQALEQADVVIWIGPNLETFLQKPLARLPAQTTLITIESLKGLILLPVRNNDTWKNSHQHAMQNDPHVWLNPENAILIINELARIFSQVDAAHAHTYHENAKKIINKLQNLNVQLKKELAPVKTIPFLVFHDGYQYFENYYGLNVQGSVAINSDLPPSAQRLHQLNQQIKQEKIVCVFTEPGTSPAIVQTLQRDTHIRVGELDSLGQGTTFDDYLILLQTNSNALIKCLS